MLSSAVALGNFDALTLAWAALKKSLALIGDNVLILTLTGLAVAMFSGLTLLSHSRVSKQVRTVARMLQKFTIQGDIGKSLFQCNGIRLHSSVEHLVSLIQDMQAALLDKIQAAEQNNRLLSARIAKLREEMEDREERLRWQINHDHLTGLPNRACLVSRMESMIEAGKRFAVLFLDLDGFKEVNDMYGHENGDALLKCVASRILKVIREDRDMVARLGGDEFVIILSDVGDENEILPVLNRIIDCVQSPFAVNDGKIAKVTPSLGIAFHSEDEDSKADTLIRHADQAMYKAKQQGGARYQIFDPDSERNYRDLQLKYSAIEAGFLSREFCLYLHPKINLMTGAVVGAETLIRWSRPDGRLALPGEFMPIVERTDLMLKMGRWIIADAILKLAALEKAGLCGISLSVNVTARQLQDPSLIDFVQTFARRQGIGLSQLEFEVVETAALGNMDEVNQTLGSLRKLGCSIAIDDFGDGYASLSYLSRLEFDTIKIDRQFISGMDDLKNRTLVEAIIHLGRVFDKLVVAEGVETVDQGCELIRLGCQVAQGFVIAKPMPLEAFIQWAPQWKAPDEWLATAEGVDASGGSGNVVFLKGN